MTTENQNTQSKAADKALSDPTCSRCGGIHANDCDSFWDDGKGGKLCQMCWEAVADEEWRDRVRAMGDIHRKAHSVLLHNSNSISP